MSCLQDIRGLHQNGYQRIMNLMYEVTFVAVGLITAVYDEGKRVDVKSAMLDEFGKETNWYSLELIRTGTPKCVIDVLPVVGDHVMVFACQNFVPTQKEGATPIARKNFLPYSPVTMKALQISPQDASDPALKVKINDEEITIDATLPVTLTASDTVDLTVSGDVKLKCDGNVTAEATQFDFNSGALTVMK